MPDGACVIRYDGKRGVVWRIKYRDATGKQVKETLGRAGEGWTKRKADAALRGRLTDVQRDGYAKPDAVTFASLAEEWLSTYPDAKRLKASTREGYEYIVRRRLVPALGHHKLETVDVARIERYVADSTSAGLAPRTVNRHLNVLGLILTAARKRRLIRENPLPDVQRPPEPRRRWRVLSPAEVRAVEDVFNYMVISGNEDERPWLETARLVFLVTYGLGLRRGEILGLRWRSVRLADPDGATLRVEETFVRGAVDTPKSERSERTIALGSRLAEELFEHRRRTAFGGDDERALCSPYRGAPLNPKAYAKTFRQALAKAGIDDYVRPFHDGRHSAITNAAAAGTSPAALMARAGHSDFQTTQLYIDLAGERFRDEAELLERRLWGPTSTNQRYQDSNAEADTTSEIAA